MPAFLNLISSHRRARKRKKKHRIHKKRRSNPQITHHYPSPTIQPPQNPSPDDGDVDGDGDDEELPSHGFHLNPSSSSSSSSYIIQPLGNLLLRDPSSNCRNTGLGSLQCLTDELLLDILSLLDPKSLSILSTTSKSLYVFTHPDPLWRNLVLHHLRGNFAFLHSWRSTYLSSTSHYSPSPSPSSLLRIRTFYSDYLFQSCLCASLEMKRQWLERDNIPRVRGISVDDFIARFEEPNSPVLLEGCLGGWKAMEKWDEDRLVTLCGDSRFAVGPVEMRLSDYFRYANAAREERPLYLFDPKFVEKVPSLGLDYDVPAYFRDDLFALLGEERPDYRWIIIGPAGSGSSFHVDPNSTSAWNAVVRGSKKWVMFPPDVVPPGVHPSPDGADVACPVSIIEWFMNFYASCKDWKKRPVECVCRAGEVVFVPNGWWHLVYNLEDSIAITQNFVSWRNLLNVLDFLKRPNASELVSGTRDRINLHSIFSKAIDSSFPGIIDKLRQKAEEKKIAQQKRPTFWESVTDARAGGFKFSFQPT